MTTKPTPPNLSQSSAPANVPPVLQTRPLPPPPTDSIPTATGNPIPAHSPNSTTTTTTTPPTCPPCHTKTQTTFTCGHSTTTTTTQTPCPSPICPHPPPPPHHHPSTVHAVTAAHECNACQRRWHVGEVQKLELEIRDKQKRLAGEERRVRVGGGARRMRDVERLIVLEEEIERLKEEKEALGELVDAVVPLEV